MLSLTGLTDDIQIKPYLQKSMVRYSASMALPTVLFVKDKGCAISCLRTPALHSFYQFDGCTFPPHGYSCNSILSAVPIRNTSPTTHPNSPGPRSDPAIPRSRSICR